MCRYCLKEIVGDGWKTSRPRCCSRPALSIIAVVVGLHVAIGLRPAGAGADQAVESKSPFAASVPPNRNVKSSVLFMSWEGVIKGRMQPMIDASRVSDDGKKVIEGLQQSWNVVFKTNGHGLEPYQLPRGIRITIEKARKSAPWLVADRPWEETLYSASVLQEKGRLRCWYSFKLAAQRQEYGFQEGRAVETSGTGLGYAESTDGVNWTKPNLGVCTFNGSKDNNIVSFENFIAGVFRDENGLAEERYKSFEFGKLPAEELAKVGGNFNSYCLFGLVSPDGFHWQKLTKPLIRHFCDTQNIGAWDPMLKKYVGFFRDHQGGRAISRAETDDFHSWPHPHPVLVPGPEDDVSEDIYSNCYTTYPGNANRRLLFPAMYHQDTDQVDVRLALSNEGRAFSWVSHDPIIELGAPGEFDSKQIYSSPNLIRLADGRLALSYLGYANTHNEAIFPGFYQKFPTPGKIAWALWEEGRLAGIEAAATGEFYVQSFRPEGDQIEINARAAAGGQVVVEIIQNGLPVAGFSLNECIPLQGDNLWTPLRWKGKTDLSELRGKKIQLHVLLKQAKIFGCRVVATANAKSDNSK